MNPTRFVPPGAHPGPLLRARRAYSCAAAPLVWALLLSALHAADMPAGHPPAMAPISAADLHFFEAKVRPVLIDNCYKCHSKDADKVLPKIDVHAELVPAKLLNTAGIVGAAWLAADRWQHPDLLK